MTEPKDEFSKKARLPLELFDPERQERRSLMRADSETLWRQMRFYRFLSLILFAVIALAGIAGLILILWEGMAR